MGVFVLVYRYRVSATTLKMLPTLTFFAVAFILNMITNLVRIIVLVLFRVPPEHTMHEYIGILCLIVYVLIPLHFLSAWMVRAYGEAKNVPEAKPAFTLTTKAFIGIIPLIVLFTGATLERNRPPSANGHANVQLGGFEPEKLGDGITKFSTHESLIYVKTIPEFFTGEHTPLMCWKGSGYEFSGVTTASVEGITVYKGTLTRADKSLHTAWWYSNGQVETISQIDWRLRMLKGEPDFCLVNVTAQDEDKLMTSVRSMLTTERLTINTDL
jgi:exosortase N